MKPINIYIWLGGRGARHGVDAHDPRACLNGRDWHLCQFLRPRVRFMPTHTCPAYFILDDQPTNQPINQPTNQPTDQLDKQTNQQPTNQQTNQPSQKLTHESNSQQTDSLTHKQTRKKQTNQPRPAPGMLREVLAVGIHNLIAPLLGFIT